MTFGSGSVFAKSGKLKIVTLSSTESESIVMCEDATYVVWMRDLLKFFGYNLDSPTKMYQDNLSAIWLATHNGAFSRNKHTILKRSFLKEKIEEGLIAPIHRDTDKMPADMLTKSMTRLLLHKHMTSIGMERV